MLQLREFECLIALSEHLHFGRAARSLQISQSRMSQTIQEIERRVGCQLFERTSRRVELTPEGKTLLDRIRPSYDQMRDSYRMAVAEIRSVEAVIRLGFTAGASRQTSDLVRALHKHAPDHSVTLREMVGADPFGALHRGEVDTLLTTAAGADPDLLAGPTLGAEVLVLAVPQDHRLAGRASVATSEFRGETVLEVDGLGYAPEGVPDPVVVQTWPELGALVAAGQGVALLTSSIAEYYGRSDVRFVPVSDLPPVPVMLVWRRSDQRTAMRTLVTAALQNAAPPNHPHAA